MDTVGRRWLGACLPWRTAGMTGRSATLRSRERGREGERFELALALIQRDLSEPVVTFQSRRMLDWCSCCSPYMRSRQPGDPQTQRRTCHRAAGHPIPFAARGSFAISPCQIGPDKPNRE
jgi:hypothetical protein